MTTFIDSTDSKGFFIASGSSYDGMGSVSLSAWIRCREPGKAVSDVQRISKTIERVIDATIVIGFDIPLNEKTFKFTCGGLFMFIFVLCKELKVFTEACDIFETTPF
eukprot:TRINITY_DN5034_c0_g4_i4.p2 TRINITY_DN5034_c0_g4~~TRINITY_DN5034_c0_g4_i4.p2  ORF type:complete len:107 (+),score=21.65 TRINITY_DN5034_c0_g4_i4:174-494(+)